MTEVTNLSTRETLHYSCPPRQAVIAAFAQFPAGVAPQREKRRNGTTVLKVSDAYTWEYENRYGHLVEEGRVSYICGDWSAMKEDWKEIVAREGIHPKPRGQTDEAAR